MNTKQSGTSTLAVMIFVASSVIASVLGYDYLERSDKVVVWRVNQTLDSGSVISKTMLSPFELPPEKGKTYLSDLSLIEGKQLTTAKQAGDILSERDFVTRTASIKLADAIPSGRVVVPLPQAKPSLPLNQLTSGDWLDIVLVTRAGPQVISQGAKLVGFMQHGGGKAGSGGLVPNAKQSEASELTLLLAVRPEEVYALSTVNAKSKVTIILRAKADVKSGDLPSLHSVRATRSVEVVTNNNRRTVVIE